MRNKTGHIAAPYRFVARIGLVLAAVAVDQLTKFALRLFFEPGEHETVIDALLSLTYVMNRGAAFGVLDGKYQFLLLFPLLTSLVILCCALGMKLSAGVRIPLLFIAAGGISNALDRIFLGYVTDMISVSFFPPVFNVADIYVTVGCGVLIVFILISGSKPDRKEGSS